MSKVDASPKKLIYLVEDVNDPETPYLFTTLDFLESVGDWNITEKTKVQIVEFKPTHQVKLTSLVKI